MPTQMRLIVGGPGRDPLFDAERLPGHGLESTFHLAPLRRTSHLIVPRTPGRYDGPEAWAEYRAAGALAVIKAMKEVRLSIDGLVTRDPRPWHRDRSAWLLIGRTDEGMSSFVPQNTRVTAHYDHHARRGPIWFTWKVG
jgi:hypothetical protein